MSTLGNTIKQLRGERGWSQQELARRAGIAQGFLSELERGAKDNPSRDTLDKLARAFAIQMSELLDEGASPFPAPTLREWGVAEHEITQYEAAWPYWSRDQRVKFLGSLRTALGLQATVRELTERAQAKKRALENGLTEDDDAGGAAPPLAHQVAM